MLASSFRVTVKSQQVHHSVLKTDSDLGESLAQWKTARSRTLTWKTKGRALETCPWSKSLSRRVLDAHPVQRCTLFPSIASSFFFFFCLWSTSLYSYVFSFTFCALALGPF